MEERRRVAGKGSGGDWRGGGDERGREGRVREERGGKRKRIEDTGRKKRRE